GPIIYLRRANAQSIHAAPARPHLDLLGSLLIHETVHTLQYKNHGYIEFFRSYLFSYFTNLYYLRSWRQDARRHAYLAIPFEREAFTIEARWSLRKQCERDSDKNSQ